MSLAINGSAFGDDPCCVFLERRPSPTSEKEGEDEQGSRPEG